ncbi:MAG: PrsW family intramembrane metalloprotease [Actinomycetota bacterium]|nr:PrsW family intramembrane metalloprotease [Actinomycetota bacterium]
MSADSRGGEPGQRYGAQPAYPQPLAGFSTHANPTRRPVRRTVITYGIMVCGFLLCWAVLAAELTTSLGMSATVIGALFAAIPVLVVVPTFLWVDRYEAEPRRFLAFGLAWGALGAATGALLLNSFFEEVVLSLAGSTQADLLGAVVSAPLVEEALKGLGILLVIVLRRKQFDGVIDGIVYAGMIGAGFAFTENILYLGRMYVEYGQGGLTTVFILRGVMGPFAHPLFTACTGVGLGLAVSHLRSAGGKVTAGLLGYLCAVLLHLSWNLAASTHHFFGAYFGFQVPVFAGFVGLVVWLRAREGRLIRQQLSRYADAGWLSHPEVVMLASLAARRQARSWARRHGGRPALRSMRSFQDSASDLALLRGRMARGCAGPAAARDELSLLQAVAAHRQGFIGTTAY